MKIDRLKILIVLFVLTGAGALYVLFSGDTKTTIKNQLVISVEDTASVKEVIFGRDTFSFHVKRNDRNIWTIDDKYRVSFNMRQWMLIGLKKMEVKRPVPAENKQKISAMLQQKGIQLQVKGTGIDKSFIIFPNSNDPHGFYYMTKGDLQPYIAHVPGLNINYATLFMAGVTDWRSKELFYSDPADIQKLIVEYPQFPEGKFSVTYTMEGFLVNGKSVKNPDNLFAYVSRYQQVNVDNYVTYSQVEKFVSKVENNPDAVITLTDINTEKSRTVKFYTQLGEKFPGVLCHVKETGDWALINPMVVQKLTVDKSYFDRVNLQ